MTIAENLINLTLTITPLLNTLNTKAQLIISNDNVIIRP